MFSNARVGRKLFCGFSAVVAVMVVMALLTGLILFRLAAVSHRAGIAGHARADLAAAVEDLRQTSLGFSTFAINGDSSLAPDARDSMDGLRRSLDAAWSRIPSDRPDVRRAVKAARGVCDGWLNGFAAHMLAAMHDTNGQAIISTAVIGNPMATSMVANAVDGADRMVTLWANQEATHEQQAIRQLATVLAFGTLLAAILSVLTGWLITRAITRPMGGVVAAMNRLVADDLSVEIPGTARRDEVGDIARAVERFKAAAGDKRALEAAAAAERTATEQQRARVEAERARTAAESQAVVTALAGGLSRLAAGDLRCALPEPFAPNYETLRGDFNRAVAALGEVVGGIAAAAGTIRGGTAQIARASDDLSRRTEQQAASLEQTAAALEQLTATLRRSAEGAAHAGEIVSGARTRAEQSGAVVRDTVAAMAAIEASSQRIAQIIGIMEEISFQTNLLALNAGVEAARAGEAGRGFAVVASEVRALAQRSTGAAKEIRGLITAGEAEVRQGVALVGRTGQSLDAIAAEVEQASTLVAAVVAAAREQATGLGEINTAVNQMDRVTQQNAAMVEESTAASRTLSDEAAELARLTGNFRLEGGPDGYDHHPAVPGDAVAGLAHALRSRALAATR